MLSANQEPVLTAPLSSPATSFGTGNRVGDTFETAQAIAAGTLDHGGDADLVAVMRLRAYILSPEGGNRFAFGNTLVLRAG